MPKTPTDPRPQPKAAYDDCADALRHCGFTLMTVQPPAATVPVAAGGPRVEWWSRPDALAIVVVLADRSWSVFTAAARSEDGEDAQRLLREALRRRADPFEAARLAVVSTGVVPEDKLPLLLAPCTPGHVGNATDGACSLFAVPPTPEDMHEQTAEWLAFGFPAGFAAVMGRLMEHGYEYVLFDRDAPLPADHPGRGAATTHIAEMAEDV